MADDAGKQGEGDKGGEEKKAAPTIKPEDFEALRSSVEKLEAKNRELLEEKKRAKQEAEQAALEAAKKVGDVEALEKSWKEKVQSIQQDFTGRLSQYEQMVSAMTAGAEAMKAASELALPGSADVLLPHIQRRLSTEIKDGKAVVRVLDAEGKPSAMSVADLKKEIIGNPAFAPLLVGSRASGGGNVGPGNGSQKQVSRQQFDAMHTGDKRKFIADGGRVLDAQ